MAPIFVITVIFMSLNEGSLTNLLMNANEESMNIGGLYEETGEIIYDFALQYFKDRNAVAVFAYKDTSLDFSSEIIKCFMQDCQMPVVCNTSIWNVTRDLSRNKPTESEVFYQHEVDGLVFVTDSAHNIQEILHTIDQQTKTIMILLKVTAEDVSNILISAWSEHHVLNLVVFNFVGEMRQLHVSVYDPFIIRNSVRGHVYTHVPSMRIKNEIWSNLSVIINTRLTNVHGYPLKIYSSGLYQEMRYLPWDTLRVILDTNNFKPLLIASEEDAEIIAFQLYPMGYRSQNFVITEFLFPIDKDEYGFITPKMQSGDAMSFVKIYTPAVSALLACAYVFIVTTWSWFQKLYDKWRKNDEGSRMNLMEISIFILGSFLLISQAGRYRLHERCLFVAWAFFSMVICFSYQGTMVEHLTAGGPSRDINTIDELLESDLKIIIQWSDLSIIQNNAIDEEAPYHYKRILERLETVGAISHFDCMRGAVFCDLPMCRIFQDINLVKYGQNYHILEEGPPDRYTSFVMPFDSPYKESFNQILMKFAENGITHKLRNDVSYNYKTLMLIHYVKNYKPDARNDVYRMKDLTFIFWSWFGCCCFSCLAFLMELLWARVCEIMNVTSSALFAIFI